MLSNAASCADFMSCGEVLSCIPAVKTARSAKRRAVLHPTGPSRLINASDSAGASSTWWGKQSLRSFCTDSTSESKGTTEIKETHHALGRGSERKLYKVNMSNYLTDRLFKNLIQCSACRIRPRRGAYDVKRFTAKRRFRLPPRPGDIPARWRCSDQSS